MRAVGTLSPYLRRIDVPAADLRGNHYEIDLGAIRHNYMQLRAQVPQNVAIYACLKRNAYGCGVGPVARALACEDIDGFAVASLLDAIAIRREGISSPVLLYPGALPLSASAVKSLDLIVTVSSLCELRQWRSAIERLRVFIKVDLGFCRAGATPSQATELLTEAMTDRKVRIEGLYAHMSELPGSDLEDAFDQLKKMNGIIRQMRCMNARVPIIMMSSTAGVLNFPEMDFDAVDPGALFVGLSDVEKPARDVVLRPALTTISTKLVAVKRLDPSLRPPAEIPWLHDGMSIGVIGMGWGDGLPRHLPNDAEALVRGKRAKLLPPSHLEHIRIDLSDIPEASFADEVTLLGRQGDEVITLEELAHHWGTDVMGVYGNLRDHIPRVYI